MRIVLRLVLAGLTASAWLLVAEGETPVFAQACNANYVGACIPLDVTGASCAGGTGNGPYYVPERNIRVVGTDVFGLDSGGVPGIGCEDAEVQATATTTPVTTVTTLPGTTATTLPGTTATTLAGTAVTAMPHTGIEAERSGRVALSLLLGGVAIVFSSTMFREKLRME